jgi:hypothetical protein
MRAGRRDPRVAAATRHRWRCRVALLVVVVLGQLATVRALDAAGRETPGLAVVVDDAGMVTVQARDAPLGEVVAAVASQVGIRIVGEGGLTSLVTTSLAGRSPEDTIRRLLHGHSFVVVYGGQTQRSVEIRLLGPSTLGATIPPGDRSAEAHRTPRARPALHVEEPGFASEMIAALTEAEDPSIRARAVGGLGQLKGPAVIAALKNALSDATAAVRIGAVYAFERVDGAGAVTAVQTSLTADPDPLVRKAAADVLGRLGGPAARAALEQAAVADRDGSVRREVRQALARLDAPR